MALSTITARVSDVDKNNFDAFCSSVGLTSSAAINMFVKAVLRERRIPFEIKQDDCKNRNECPDPLKDPRPL